MKASSAVLLQPNKSRPGMRSDLITRLIGWAAGIVGDEAFPDAALQPHPASLRERRAERRTSPSKERGTSQLDIVKCHQISKRLIE